MCSVSGGSLGWESRGKSLIGAINISRFPATPVRREPAEVNDGSDLLPRKEAGRVMAWAWAVACLCHSVAGREAELRELS